MDGFLVFGKIVEAVEAGKEKEIEIEKQASKQAGKR